MARRISKGGGGLLAAGLLAAAPVAAQVTDTPVIPAPVQTPGAVPLPPAPVIVLPDATPSPAAPRPAPSRTSAPRATATPRASPSPTPSALPSPSSAASTTPPVPATLPTPSPSTTPVANVTVPAASGDGGMSWPGWVVAGAIILAVAGWMVVRRRRIGTGKAFALPAPAPVEGPPSPPRARLTLVLRPRRAGINLLSATCENEIVVTNTGTAPADDIRLQLRLLSAHGEQDDELAAYYAEPIGRPVVPAFALAPGEARTLSVVAALPREAIRPLTAAGRPMFVPIVAVNVVYATAGSSGQLAQAFAIGVERVDSPKLSPFWLDMPARSFDQVAARPHAVGVDR